MTQGHSNRLIQEKSPYLLQHAHNPVDWYPWSEEAFIKARQQNKPVFLSIGYSTCHWCHVMAHESFESEEIARVLNEHFVSIKVDREERPDIDNIYMMAVTALTGSGGWPLSVFLTPDKKPFYGGTYFPPTPKWGSVGFRDLLLSIHQTWQADPGRIVASSQSISDALKERTQRSIPKDDEPTLLVLEQGFSEFARHFDPRFGGFGQAPKFPMGHSLSFLMRYWKRSSDERALNIAEHTLRKMMAGGIYDHLGGGFHRYATDQEWQVPHFEKMLYDQAILAKAYLEAYQITREASYARLVQEVLDYVLRDMCASEGGFYSAEDADSLDPQENEKKEGAFYLWTKSEIDAALSKEEAEVFNYYFGVEAAGNARFDPHGEFVGKNILHVAHSVEATASAFGKSPEVVARIVTESKEKLFVLRQKRPRPHLDDKVLTDWNGLMISACALAARTLGEKRYAQAAVKAAEFILNSMRDTDRLLHRYRDGSAGIMGTLEDYAFFAQGLLDLYEAVFDVRYLQEAKFIAENMLGLFWDDAQGGMFFTATDGEELLFRHKEIYDGAIPSGNSVALGVLARLGHMTADKKFIAKAEAMARCFVGEVRDRPSAYAQFLSGVDILLGPSAEIIIAEGKDGLQAADLVKEVNNQFLPRAVLMWRPLKEDDAGRLLAVAPFLKDYKAPHGQACVYICEGHACQQPVHTVEALRQLLV